MKTDPPETAELFAFLAVVDSGSINRAAEELGLPRATVSRRLARLEERLGVRLLRRTTRRLAITDAGRQLDPHARRIVAAIQLASDHLTPSDGEPRGLLRVSMPPGRDSLFDSVVLSFLRRYPKVRLELDLSTRQVDLVAGGFDVALRASTHLDPGLVARRLSMMRMMLFGSIDYLERRGRPSSPADLANHDCLVGYERGERPSTHWPLLEGGQIRIEARLATNDLALLTDAVLAGEGLALLPESFVRHGLASGGLRAVLEDSVGATSQLAIVYAERAHLAPAVRAFVDHVVDNARDFLDRV